MLTPEQIIGKAHEAGLYQDGINTQLPLWVLTQQELEWFVRAIEAEVRKRDDALIQQMLAALENTEDDCGFAPKQTRAAITAGRARLAPSTEPASNSTRTTNDRL